MRVLFWALAFTAIAFAAGVAGDLSGSPRAGKMGRARVPIAAAEGRHPHTCEAGRNFCE